MKYKINIQKYVENPQYAEQLEDYEKKMDNQYYRGTIGRPEPYLSTTALDVELTEEEYKKVKAEVIKVFE